MVGGDCAIVTRSVIGWLIPIGWRRGSSNYRDADHRRDEDQEAQLLPSADAVFTLDTGAQRNGIGLECGRRAGFHALRRGLRRVRKSRSRFLKLARFEGVVS